MGMDDIDRAKIGKKDEPLRGWDHLRKPKMNTDYPPMKARGAKNRAIYPRPYSSYGGWWILFLVAFIALGILLFVQLVFKVW
jgi:hypothetical protein